MLTKLAAVIIGVMLVLVFLSFIAPAQSQRKFWIMIRKFRAGLDLVVYWFFNVCAILSILYLVLMTARGFFL